MKILNVGCYCSERLFQKLLDEKYNPEISIQKYYSLFVKGLVANGCNVHSLCQRQMKMSWHISYKKAYKEAASEKISFKYLPYISLPVFNQILLFISSFVYAFCYFIKEDKKNTTVICDLMRFWVSMPVLLASKIFGFKTVALVADIPQMYNQHRENGNPWYLKLFQRIYLRLDYNYDGYIFLSKHMNECVNKKNKPFMIMEGIVDGDNNFTIEKDDDNSKFVITYTGGLYKKFGVDMLLDAILSLNDTSIELQLCGKGELVEKIDKLSSVSTNIKYFGVVPNEQAVKLQLNSTVLINPRFSDSDFTKYSFPSKTMEYMLTGNPVISTRLKGIPEEYFEYIIPLEDESVTGLCELINQLKSTPCSELKNKGKLGRKFVVEQKNHIHQATRVICWLESVV